MSYRECFFVSSNLPTFHIFVLSQSYRSRSCHRYRPNHPVDAPALILPSPLPQPPRKEKPRPATPSPPAPSLTKKRPAPDDDIQELDGPSAKRARVDGVDATGAVPFTPSKKRRLDEDGLILLDSAEEKIEEDPDVIEID